jgi:hypothetical protein
VSILKIKRVADIVDELQLFEDDPFTVNVRALTQRQREDLYEASSREVRAFGGTKTRVQDDKLWNENAPLAYVDGWEKLSPLTLTRLNIFVEEPPATNDDGCIPYSQELSQELWREADRSKYCLRIIQHSSDIGENRAKVESLKKSTLLVSSGSSTNLESIQT